MEGTNPLVFWSAIPLNPIHAGSHSIILYISLSKLYCNESSETSNCGISIDHKGFRYFFYSQILKSMKPLPGICESDKDMKNGSYIII